MQSCQSPASSTKAEDTIETGAAEASNQKDTKNNILYYWDNFDFSDFHHASKPEIGEQHFVDFINLFPNANHDTIKQGIDSLIAKSSPNPQLQEYFQELLNRYLYDVNSPFYNESYYILALESLSSSKYVKESDKIRYHTLLNIASRNKVGELATDFTFYSQENHTLHSLKAKYLVLFFYVPDCQSCQENLKILKENPQIKSILDDKALTLAIYADGNKEIWQDYAGNIPKEWINGIDLNQQILKQGLYDLKASPTIYLLDKDKKVLLKDTNLHDLLRYLKDK